MKKIALLAALISFCISAQALDKVNLALDWYINPDHAPILVAEQQGYFKQQGLDVNLLTPVQSTEPAQLVASGQADMAIDYQPSLLIEIDSGMPLVWVGTLVNQPLNCIVVLADSPYMHFADLKGQSIGYSASPSTQAMLNTMLAYHHLSANSVNQINIQMDLIQALLSHKVTAVDGMMRNVEPVQMAEMGYGTRAFYPEENGVPSYDELVFIANSKTVNRGEVARFNKALAQAVSYLKAHPTESWQKASAAYTQQLAPNAQMAKANQAIWMASIQYFSDNPSQIDPGRYQNFADSMLKNGLIKQSISIQRYQGN
ncbi:MAG: putative thiamine biosynthesis protein [Gammaproteobacteria bacterium]|jgi:putative hydroxymethylpyrimidine transport system substrate-binding protein|nr:putative thiamine biosynthesis protein [Gammaproteobacteria bacterium]